MTIGPYDILQPGTTVYVSGKRGEIVSHREARDQHGGPIVVHTIHLTHKFTGRSSGKTVWKRMARPQTKEINYAAIQLCTL